MMKSSFGRIHEIFDKNPYEKFISVLLVFRVIMVKEQ